MLLSGRLVADDVPRLGGDLVGEIPVAACERVPERRNGLVRRPVPARAEALQQAEVVRARAAQLRAEELQQQPVIAVPDLGPGVAGDEEVRCRELGQHPAAVAPAGQRVGELRADRVRNGRTEQELAQAVGLPVEDLVQQVVRDGPIVARETAQEAGAIRLRGERERGEADPGGPALGAIAQRLDIALGQIGRERLERLAALVHGERELGGPDLGEVVRQAQALQAQARVRPCREHQPEPARRAVDECLQLPLDDRALDLVEVVEHEHHGLVATFEAVGDLHRQAHFAGVGRRAVERAGAGERALDAEPEARAPVVVAVEPEPGDAPRLGLRGPRRQQHRLPRACVRRDERHQPCRSTLDQLVQPRAVDQARRGRGRNELRSRERHGRASASRWSTGVFDGNRLHRSLGSRGWTAGFPGWLRVFQHSPKLPRGHAGIPTACWHDGRSGAHHCST